MSYPVDAVAVACRQLSLRSLSFFLPSPSSCLLSYTHSTTHPHFQGQVTILIASYIVLGRIHSVWVGSVACLGPPLCFLKELQPRASPPLKNGIRGSACVNRVPCFARSLLTSDLACGRGGAFLRCPLVSDCVRGQGIWSWQMLVVGWTSLAARRVFLLAVTPKPQPPRASCGWGRHESALGAHGLGPVVVVGARGARHRPNASAWVYPTLPTLPTHASSYPSDFPSTHPSPPITHMHTTTATTTTLSD